MVLSHYLDNYINPIESSQLKVALTSGEAELKKVTIKPTALLVHHLPFTVTSGIIQSIKLHFPWTSLKTQPCVIELDGIHIIANFLKDAKLKSEVEIKESVLQDLEDAGLTDEKVVNALFGGFISQIISNIIIRIKNVHIRIEIDTPDPETTYGIGLMFDKIECFSIGEKGEQTFVQPDANITKRLEIEKFSIYADPQPKKIQLPTKPENIEEYLNLRFSEKHEYILEKFSFSSDCFMSKRQLQTMLNMDNQIDQINFKMSQKQMTVLGEYLFQYNLYQLRQKYSVFGRPNKFPNGNSEEKKRYSLQWWKFAHLCTIEKRYPNRINIKESVLILRTRNDYHNIWKIRQSMSIQDFKSNSNYAKLKKIEDKLPLNSILFLRNYSNYRINKEEKDKSKLVIEQSDLDILTSSTALETGADISLLIKKIKLRVYESPSDVKPVLTFAAHEITSKLSKSFEKSLDLSFICKTMKVYSHDKVIFQQDETDRSSIEMKYHFEPVEKEESVDIVASAPFINVDLKFLYKLKVMLYDNGFSKCPSSNHFTFKAAIADKMTEEANKYEPLMIRKGQYADMILQKKCDEYPYMKINMKLLSPKVKIQGARLSFQVKEINLESFPIHKRSVDQVESLYINYLLKCTDFTIGLADYIILKPVTIDFNLGMSIAPVEWLDKFRIALNISSIAVVFHKDSYREIVSGLGQLLKLTQDFEQTETGKALMGPSKPEKPKNNYIDNMNMENLSTNYATKVLVVFDKISLELVTVGRFDIINFETQVTAGSNGLGLDLRIKNIICNSLENKYIFFDVNEADSDNHFLKENNAIVCNYTLFFDKATKMNMSINTPTIIIDFGWLESTLDFFKCADLKSLTFAPTKEIKDEAEAKIMETVMTNSIEFLLLKPTFKVILPAFNKLQDDVELTLNLDYISFGETESETNGKKNMLLKMPTFSFEWKKRLTATIDNFSILIGDKFSFYFDDLTVFDIVEDRKNIEIKSLKPKEDDSLPQPFIVLQMEEDKIDTTINDCSFIFDVNSYMIPELILSLLKSSIITQIISKFMEETEMSSKEEEKPSSTAYYVNMPNFNLTLIDKDIKLNCHFIGTFTVSPTINHMFFSDMSLSFSEKQFDFHPIFEHIALEFGTRNGMLIFTLGDINVFISPSDIIDVTNFFNKVMNLYSNFCHQLDYSRSNEVEEKTDDSNPIQNLQITNNQIVFELVEDNRTTQVPYPFLRLIIKPKSTKVSLVKEPSFLLLDFQLDIFNKKTQRWDMLIEPLGIFLEYVDTKHYKFEIKHYLNLTVSHAILNQICQFQFEKQSISNEKVLPGFYIQNNTRETCEFIFNDTNDNISIPSQCSAELKKAQPFRFMETVVDPLNFFSPQVISDKYSVSIFNKGKERYISINAPLLLKNRSNLDLFYKEKHTGNVFEVRKNSITPLIKLAAEFTIYGNEPKKTPQTINLFRLKDQGKLYIPVYIGPTTYYYFLSIKFSNKRGIVMLTLTPNYKIINNYKKPIVFSIDRVYQVIPIEGKSVGYLNRAGFKSSFNLFIEANNHFSKCINLSLEKSTFVPVYFTPNNAFGLRFDKDIITLQPPLIALNLTSLPVSIFDYKKSLILTLDGKGSEDFIGPPDFFKADDNKINLCIQVDGYEKSELFDTAVGHKQILIKSLNNDLCIPFGLLFSFGATGIIHMKIDHLVHIRNESIQKLHFKAPNNEELIIEPQQTKPVLLGTSGLDFDFSIDNCKDHIQINLQNTLENRNKFATLILNPQNDRQIALSVDFQSSSTLAGYYIVIKDCVFPQPLVLTNLLGEKISKLQSDIFVGCGFPSHIIVSPMSTSIVSSRDLVGQKLKVSFYERDFEVDLTKFKEPTKETVNFKNMNVSVYLKLVCLENGSHLVIISNDIENKPNRFNLFSTHEISFGLSIPFISLNLIDDQMRELALIGLSETSVNCQFTEDTVEMDFQIGMFQIDDMYPDTIVPVAVFNSSPPFISLKMIKENANMIFDLIELKMKPLTFYIDINYVAELFNFFTTIKLKETDEMANVEASSIHSSIPILVKKIFIDKVSINASASSKTGRPTFHPFPYAFIMDFIPTVSGVQLDRTAFTQTDLSSDSKVLNKMLKDYYDPLVRDVKGLVAARSILFAFKGLSNAIHKMSNTSKIDVSFNQEKGKVIQRSFRAFGKGLLDGVTGIVMKPIKGAKKDGAKGFFIGLGKGVSGIITDPLAGAIDAGAGVVDEIKNALSESRDSMRFPRVFNNSQVEEYDQIGAICQLQYQRHAKDYDEKFVYFIHGEGDTYIGVTRADIVFLIPNKKKKKNPSKKYMLHAMKPISDIETVNTSDKDLIIIFKDGYSNQITCQSSDVAEVASKIIVSRSYYSNYRSDSASMTKMASTELLTTESQSNEKLVEAIVQKECIIKDGFYSLKNSHGKFVTNDKEYMPLLGNRGKAQGWEKFQITNNDDGTVSFLSCKNNKYVTVGSKSKLFATATKISSDEKFSVNKIGENLYNFISMKTGLYVTSNKNHANNPLFADRKKAQGWEKFELIPRD